MAIATNQSMLDGVTGRTGAYVTRTVNNRSVVSQRSKGRSKRSEVEKTNHSHFQQAASYAKFTMLDPVLKARFKAEAKRRKLSNAYTAALSFKLKELKTDVKVKRQALEELAHETVVNTAPNDTAADNFNRLCNDTEVALGGALTSISALWTNIKETPLSEAHLAFLRSVVRAEIRRKLDSI